MGIRVMRPEKEAKQAEQYRRRSAIIYGKRLSILRSWDSMLPVQKRKCSEISMYFEVADDILKKWAKDGKLV
jgi:hypothetical protein